MNRMLRRLGTVRPGELAWRLTSGLRKTADRVRSAAVPPRWPRPALRPRLRTAPAAAGPLADAAEALRLGDDSRAHVALARYFSQRSGPWPLSAGSLSGVAAAIRRDFPAAAQAAVDRAEAIAQGRYDLLGYHGVELGPAPDWHWDGVHGRRMPLRFWASVPYLDPRLGDHKVVWELNRHQHWLALGRAQALAGGSRFPALFTAQLGSWLDANPPLLGTNWASMLEIGFRSLSWLWAIELFAGTAGPDDERPWLVELLGALDRQLAHVERNLSYYFSPNTHLTGEALALYAAGLALPELQSSGRRAGVGRRVLLEEAVRQIRGDGGHAEQSPHYHRYSTDFYLLATNIARRAGDAAADLFEDAARRQARFLRAITDDRGYRPAFGDDDGGQLFPICGRPPEDCSDTLATAAVLLGEPALAVGPVPEETYWLCGPEAVPAVPAGRAAQPSTVLAASGYLVSRTGRGDHLTMDAGPHGFLNGGHAHADALSCTLTVAGEPVLIDPGTATYTMNPELRDRFRSTMMHNTVALDGRMQAEPRGPFHWTSRADAYASLYRTGSGCDYFEGTHDAYAPRRHTRAVAAVHGIGWWILDHVLGDGEASVETYWHVDPRWSCTPASAQVVTLESGRRALALASSIPLTLLAPGTHPLAVCSPSYGRVDPAPTLRGVAKAALPATAAAFVPADGAAGAQLALETLRVDAEPGPGWHACAFRARWEGGIVTVLSAIEVSGIARSGDASPGKRWGTADYRTDARLAVIIDRRGSEAEAILVNGRVLESSDGRGGLSLPAPAALIRAAVPALAPTVHEVAAAPMRP